MLTLPTLSIRRHGHCRRKVVLGDSLAPARASYLNSLTVLVRYRWRPRGQCHACFFTNPAPIWTPCAGQTKAGREPGSVFVTAQRPAITDSAPKCCSSLSIGLVSVVLLVGLVVSGDNGRLILARPSVCSIGKLKDGHPECHDC